MAQSFKHKETGEIIKVPRVRYYITDAEVTSRVDLSGTYDLSQYDDYVEEYTTSYETIRATKSKMDGNGIR